MDFSCAFWPSDSASRMCFSITVSLHIYLSLVFLLFYTKAFISEGWIGGGLVDFVQLMEGLLYLDINGGSLVRLHKDFDDLLY